MIAAVWALTTLLWLTPGITRPDGIGYFVYLPSTFFDHDLLFFDEWVSFDLIQGDGRILYKEITATGYLGNHWPSGSAILWYPAYVVGAVIDAVSSGIPTNEGTSLPYVVATVFMSALAGLFTLILCFPEAESRFGTKAATLACVAVWIGSPLMWYSLKNSLMSHAPGALVSSLVVVLALRLRRDLDRWSLLSFGLALGFACAIRAQNAALAAVPLFLLMNEKDRLIRTVRSAGWIVLGGLVGLLPQLVVSQALYGSPLGFVNIGVSGGSKPFPIAPFERIWIWEPLFSWFHGMVPWTPVLAIAVAGFWLLWRHDRGLGAAAFFAFAAQWLVNATLERSFWGGYAFGQRRFDNCTIFFVLGLAAIAARWYRPIMIATTLCLVWTVGLFFASSLILDLNTYTTPGETISAVREAVFRAVTGHLVPLAFVPPSFRMQVGMVCLAVLVVGILILFALRRIDFRGRCLAALGYLLLFSIWFALAAGAGGGRVDSYRNLIAYNRSLGVLAGAVDFRVGLMEEEARFLRKSGRIREAERTEAELRQLVNLRLEEAARRGRGVR